MILLHYKSFHKNKFVSEGVVFMKNHVNPEDVLKKWNGTTNTWSYRKAGVYDIKGTITPLYTLPFHEIRVITCLGCA